MKYVLIIIWVFCALNAAPAMAETEVSLVDIKVTDALDPSQERCGQGVIIDSSGIIATSKHIIGDTPEHIYVVLAGGKTFEASIVRNSDVDLTLVKINAPFLLRPVSLGDSSNVHIGNHVFAVANAASSLERKHSGEVIKVYDEESVDAGKILEMNIHLKPGDSGGPILNEDGLLLGLIMASQKSDPGKSYAIASGKIQQEYYASRNSVLISSLR